MPSFSMSTYEVIRDRANLLQECIDGLTSKSLKIGDYVNWAQKYEANGVFSDNLGNINDLMSVFNKQLVNISGYVYKVQSL